MTRGKAGAIVGLGTVVLFTGIGYSMGSKGQRALPVIAGLFLGLIMAGPAVMIYATIADKTK